MKINDIELKQGDIFRWKYLTQYEIDCKKPISDIYWCKSRIAIFDGTNLYDTYWSSDNLRFTENNINEYEFTYLENMSNLDLIHYHSKSLNYYNSNDIIDLTHPNGGNVYLKKSAIKSDNLIKLNLYLHKQAVIKKIAEQQRELERLNEIIDNGFNFENDSWILPNTPNWYSKPSEKLRFVFIEGVEYPIDYNKSENKWYVLPSAVYSFEELEILNNKLQDLFKE